MISGLFSDSPPPPFSAHEIQSQFFDGPNPTGTIPDLYREMSGGLVQIRGEVLDWRRSNLSQAQVAGSVSGVSGPPSARVGQFIVEVLSQIQYVDWGGYDNDGPDGLPNSGDDDGYVDVLAVLHPTPGAECGGSESLDRIWSHKWVLVDPVTKRGGALGQAFVTSTPSANGDRIRINNYTVQPVTSCNGSTINEIGVMAHELGHGFGLPDLYSVSGGHAGAGRWDLMGTGAWGCSATFEPQRPCPMGAWSKAALGWVDVQEVPFGTDLGTLTLDPVETSRRALAIPSGDGSGEYYLLENRQRIGFDAALPAAGLLIWQIDPAWIEARLGGNSINANGSHMGVWLRQADGLNQLASPTGNRGDAGDPFPGATGNAVFHAGSNPASFTNAEVATGVTVTDIALQGQRVSFRTLSRYLTLRVRGTGDAGAGELFTVDGVVAAGNEVVIRSAPFQRHTIEASPGASLGEGIRRAFSGWEDAPGRQRLRDWTTGLQDAELVAEFGGPREVRLGVTLEGGRFDVAPGEVVTTPASSDSWFAEGTTASLQAQPTGGFQFRSWKGALAGDPNPAILLMDQPRDATAVFEMVFGVAPNVTISIPAATPEQIILQADHANLPVSWELIAGPLPEGIAFSEDGSLAGSALDAGTFPLTLAVTDALGLMTAGSVTLQVTAPVIGTAVLAAPFLLQENTLTVVQELYLDRVGNSNGVYDLGDLRAYVLANPGAPSASQAVAGGPRRVPIFELSPEGQP